MLAYFIEIRREVAQIHRRRSGLDHAPESRREELRHFERDVVVVDQRLGQPQRQLHGRAALEIISHAAWVQVRAVNGVCRERALDALVAREDVVDVEVAARRVHSAASLLKIALGGKERTICFNRFCVLYQRHSFAYIYEEATPWISDQQDRYWAAMDTQEPHDVGVPRDEEAKHTEHKVTQLIQSWGLSRFSAQMARQWLMNSLGADDGREREDLKRLRKWLLLQLNRRQRPEILSEWQRGCPEIVPALRAMPRWDCQLFPWVQALEEAYPVIKEELLALKSQKGFQPYRAPSWASNIEVRAPMIYSCSVVWQSNGRLYRPKTGWEVPVTMPETGMSSISICTTWTLKRTAHCAQRQSR